MFRKYLVIIIILFALFACNKKEDPLKTIQVGAREEITTMADIAEHLDFDMNDNYWDEQPQIIVEQPQEITTTATNQTQRPTTQRPTTTTPRPVEHGEFTAQLISLKDKERVEEIRRTLANAAYFTEISEAEVNGETHYRLRLVGSFSRSYAEYLAQRIQSEFSEISAYWVVRR